MTELSRLLDERFDERIISAINDLDFQQFQELITNLLKSIGVIATSKEELGDAVIFRGEGEEGAYLVMASRLFDHASLMNVRRVKALASSEGRNPVLMLTNDLEPDARAFADKEGISYADKKRLLLLLRKYQLADAMMQEIDKRILAADGERVLPSAGRFDQHMLAAIEHMGKGRFKDAIYSLDRALELKPSSDQVWQSRANALFNIGRLEEALESARRATELRPADHASWYLMGLILGQMEDYEGEVKAYDAVLKLQPGNRSALLNKGTALYRMGKLDKAMRVYDQMLKAFPEDVMAHNNRGIVLKAMGRTEEALASFQRASALDRGYINPLLNMGVIHSECGQHELAVEDWRRALQLERRRPDILMSLGASLKAIGELEEALMAFGSALEIDPDLEEARAQRDELEAVLAPPVQEPACETPIEQGTREEPEQVEAPVTGEDTQLPAVIEGEVLPAEVGRPGAMTVVTEGKDVLAVIEDRPLPAEAEVPGQMVASTASEVPAVIEAPGKVSEVSVQRELAVIDEKTTVAEVERPGQLTGMDAPGPLAETRPVARQSEASIDPLRRHELTIRFMMLVGDLPEALAEADRSLAEHPGEVSLMRLKAKVLAQSGRHDAALALMSEIYGIERDERLLYDIEAISYLFGQRKEGAQILSRMTPTRESLAREMNFLLDTEQSDVLLVKASKTGHNVSGLSMQAQALTLMRKARYRDAAKIWKDILAQTPGHAEGLNNLGVCMRFMGEYGYEEPIRFMLLATLVDPMYADAFNNVGCAYFAAGVYDEALVNFGKAIAIDRKPEYYLNMSSVQLAFGDVEGAKASLTSALKLEESAEVLYMLAIIAEKEGDLKWAMRLYEDAIAARPDFKDAMFNLQRIKLQLKYGTDK